MSTLIDHYLNDSSTPAWLREMCAMECEELRRMSVGGAPAGAALIEDLRLHPTYSAGPAERGPNSAEGHSNNAGLAPGVMAAASASPRCAEVAGPSNGDEYDDGLEVVAAWVAAVLGFAVLGFAGWLCWRGLTLFLHWWLT